MYMYVHMYNLDLEFDFTKKFVKVQNCQTTFFEVVFTVKIVIREVAGFLFFLFSIFLDFDFTEEKFEECY